MSSQPHQDKQAPWCPISAITRVTLGPGQRASLAASGRIIKKAKENHPELIIVFTGLWHEITVIHLHQVEKVNDVCRWHNNYFAMCSDLWPFRTQSPALRRETDQKQSPSRTHLLAGGSSEVEDRASSGCCQTFRLRKQPLKKKK